MDQNQQLIALLSNPAAFGILISLFYKNTSWFQDKKTLPAVKIGVVLLTCVAWSIVMALLGDTSTLATLAGWKVVLVTGVAVAFSSQIFHQIANHYAPALGDFLMGFKATPTISASKTEASINQSANDSTGKTINVPNVKLAETTGG